MGEKRSACPQRGKADRKRAHHLLEKHREGLFVRSKFPAHFLWPPCLKASAPGHSCSAHVGDVGACDPTSSHRRWHRLRPVCFLLETKQLFELLLAVQLLLEFSIIEHQRQRPREGPCLGAHLEGGWEVTPHHLSSRTQVWTMPGGSP